MIISLAIKIFSNTSNINIYNLYIQLKEIIKSTNHHNQIKLHKHQILHYSIKQPSKIVHTIHRETPKILHSQTQQALKNILLNNFVYI